MFTFNPNVSDICSFPNPKTLSWNKSTDCCSWDGVHCEEMTGQVIELDLRCSRLQGKFHPNSSLFQLSNLKRLDLSYNNFFGSPISPKFSELSSLTHLDLSYSGFTGVFPAEISHLTKLQFLRIWTVDPYGLRLGPYNFELLLKNLTQLRYLDLYSVNISSTIPLNFSSYLTTLQLPDTQLHGVLPKSFPPFQLGRPFFTIQFPNWSNSIQHLSNNSFSGKIQEFKSNNKVYFASVKQNQLQGPIPKSLLDLQDLQFLILSQNNFSGQIPSTVCNLKTLELLDLGSNNLNGTIPQCLGEMSGLTVLDLNNNRLSGTINTTFNTENQLNIINLYGNKLKGKVPPSLINCRYLEFLDLDNNELNDTFPSWLGGLPGLKILSLRSNKLHGPISDSRTDNLFAQIQNTEYVADASSGVYANTLIVTTKGLDLELPRVLTTYMIIDLSRNRFEGYLPSIIGDLAGLRMLNLSHNGLEGIIPTSLQHLSVLESLDLSSNKIGGEIPQQLASLTFLAVLNLSHNHLVRCIPKGKQFDTFDNSSYRGNDGLRGLQLSKDCGGDDGVPQATTPVELDDEEEDEGDLISWQAVLMGFGSGLVIGLSIIYIMLSTHYLVCFLRMVVKFEQRIVTTMERHKKRY
ncbi:putative serine/threonine-protein phosphatase PP2A catalytic subunit-like isoform 1 [Capsicum annuum]|nr:putative serine/threonine-protein phosphatase PP2A catalytic subunit-like isoform 1 [Capsicum annuum]